MKRSLSELSSSPISSASDTDVKPEISSTSLESRRSQSTPKTPTPNKKIKKEATGGGSGGGNGEWDSQKKAIMMDIIIAAGYRATDLDSLAAKVCHLPVFAIWQLS
jgi:hypothetical protein